MSGKVSIDTRALERRVNQITEYIQSSRPIEIASEVTNTDIQWKTDAGLDADLKPFHEYAPSTLAERKKLGLGSEVNLKRTGGLRKLSLNKNTLVPDDKHTAIAHGQITGMMGKWGYGRNWLDVGKDTVKNIGVAIAKGLKRL